MFAEFEAIICPMFINLKMGV